MLKKIIVGSLITAVAAFALPNDELSLLMVNKAVEKKIVVLANMKLRGDTKVKFGTLYDEYQIKLMQQRMSVLDLINNYALNYTNMTENSSNKLIVQWMDAEEAELLLKKEYMSKFKNIMPSADVIRYFQIENRLQLVRELGIASLLPLAQPEVLKTTEVK